MLRRLVLSPTLRRCSLPAHRPGGVSVHTNLVDSLQTPVGAAAADIGRARHRSNRSRRGLYDGKDVLFGNQGECAPSDGPRAREISRSEPAHPSPSGVAAFRVTHSIVFQQEDAKKMEAERAKETGILGGSRRDVKVSHYDLCLADHRQVRRA